MLLPQSTCVFTKYQWDKPIMQCIKVEGKFKLLVQHKHKVFMDTARDCMIVITAGSSQEDIESTNINPSAWNPFTPNKLLIILFTVLYTFPMMLVLRGGVGLTCVNVVRRKSVLVSHRSESQLTYFQGSHLIAGIHLSCGNLNVSLHITFPCLLCTIYAQFEHPICINLSRIN